MVLGLVCLAPVPSARAFAPTAAATLAGQAAGALPLAARWDATWSGAAALAVTQRLEREAVDPEAAVESHRFDAEHWDAAAPDGAPAALAAACEALRAAFAARDAERVSAAVADLCVSAADLADPFQVTAPDPAEVAGARAAFSDLIDPADLAGLTPVSTLTAGDGTPGSAGLAAGLTLALESAASRRAIEDAARNRDDATVAVVRRDRLEAALSVARVLILEAWQAAGSPALDGADAMRLRAWPNPARGAVSLAFSLPSGGRARVELLDVAGRRCWSRDLDLAAGPQQLALSHAALAALPPGVYVARVRSASTTVTGRMVRTAE